MENKYKEAITYLCDTCLWLKMDSGKKCEWDGPCGHIRNLKELAEKATPKKGIDIEDVWGDSYLCCPNCKKPIVNVWSAAEYKPNYCHYCGQKYDWGN